MGNCGSSDPNVNLHELCKKGDANALRRLLTDKYIDVNGRDHRTEPFNTPLIDATISSNLECVRLLLKDDRVDPNVRNEEGNTALHLAVRDGKMRLNYEIAELILKDPRTTVHARNKEDKKPFQYLDVSANKELLEKLLEEFKVDPNVTPTPTADKEKIEKSLNPPKPEVKKLHGVDEKAEDNPTLHDACRTNDAAAVRKILESKTTHVDVNGHDHRNEPFNTPLIDATSHKNIEIVRILLADDRVDPNYRNEEGNTALHYTIHGHLRLDYEIAELLLSDARTSIHVRDKHDKKPFDYLEKSKNQELFEKFLLEKNIDIEAKTPTADQEKINKTHHTPPKDLKKQHNVDASAADSYALHDACKQGKVQVVRQLLNNEKIDVNGRDHRSEPFNTPIIDAAASHSLEAVRVLLEDDRVNPNARNEEGDTALHRAIKGKLLLDLECAEILLKNPRVDVHVRDNHDKKALSYVESSPNKEKLEKFLSENKIDVNAATPTAAAASGEDEITKDI